MCVSCEQGAEGLLLLDRNLNQNLTTTRYNQATQAEYDDTAFENPFAEGAYRWVAKGVYTEGDRKGQLCVCKWFKTGQKNGNKKILDESELLDADLAVSKEAIRIITLWNSEKFINRTIQVNLPEVWMVVSDVGGTMPKGTRVIQEPFIDNYEKFNSNSGWSNDKYPWARVMQALSHYSYHITNGQSLLCDLQGGVYDDRVVLTDPAIMTSQQKDDKYGPTDLGVEGIDNFFAHHTCNEFCSSAWKKPRIKPSTGRRSRPFCNKNKNSKKRRRGATT
jgi:hypothetical protein